MVLSFVCTKKPSLYRKAVGWPFLRGKNIFQIRDLKRPLILMSVRAILPAIKQIKERNAKSSIFLLLLYLNKIEKWEILTDEYSNCDIFVIIVASSVKNSVTLSFVIVMAGGKKS